MRYLPGYEKGLAKISSTQDVNELLQVLDSLFGRDKLRYGDGIEEVRAEAIRQYKIEMQDRDWLKEHNL